EFEVTRGEEIGVFPISHAWVAVDLAALGRNCRSGEARASGSALPEQAVDFVILGYCAWGCFRSSCFEVIEISGRAYRFPPNSRSISQPSSPAAASGRTLARVGGGR
ncbi:hypothetical protein, partial [Bradyrhizobium liaoningense]|uniref:hypothetical protein n=1 Tax=Bradyrhizobium liaoningense TaxID=43992 RepID=UPI001AEC34B7